MLFAVIKTGGKQYFVKEGDVIEIEKIPQGVGEKVEFSDVLAVFGDKFLLGKPKVEEASVKGEVLAQFKTKKVVSIKFKSKTRYRKKTGARQEKTKVKINKIEIKE
ncbi:MAG: 50S ribosomal protein L21 [Parcubacteria group bacterium ADurb.Bin159]|jgi:large subunit ribosomal protein L21|nr:MAG: 50S ribosomal protein L21 [Parcubacteria group bacterium ADurb.Bin159]